jgi:TldD protein
MNKTINRRDFLKTGGVAAAGTILLPSMLQGCFSATGSASPLSYQLNDYLNHFGVTKAMIMEVIAEGLSRGGIIAISISSTTSATPLPLKTTWSTVPFPM